MEIDLGNNCFYDDDGDFDPADELCRVLHMVSLQTNMGYCEAKVFDVNGHKIGNWEIKQ